MKHFSAMDGNNDGDVTREEFMRQMMQSRGAPGPDARGPQGPMGDRRPVVPLTPAGTLLDAEDARFGKPTPRPDRAGDLNKIEP